MALVRSVGNESTEQRLVRLLRTHRITGWRRGVKLLGSPDFVWRREHVALFVDGCFWHGCPRHGSIPKTRTTYWAAKLTSNSKRDRKVTRYLRLLGWTVIRVWECALSPQRQLATISRIEKTLKRHQAAR